MLTCIMTQVGPTSAERGALWSATCKWKNTPFSAQSRTGASYELCRILVEAGCPDQVMELRNADNFLMGTIKSIHYAATRTIEEGNRTIRERKYRPFSDSL